jgi:tetratricopeptide (TPR) repeat protein
MDGDRLTSYSDLTAEGNSLVKRGDFRRAIENFERAVRLAEDLQDAALHVKALLNLSTARLAAGQIREAEKGLRQILLKTRDPQTIFVTSSNLASALRRQGNLDRALLYARRAMRACESLDNISWRATCHNLLGNIYMNMSYLDDAVAEYRFALEAMQIALRNDNTRCLAECHQDLCFAYMQLKDLPRAREHGEKSLEVAMQLDYRDIQKNCYYLLGETHLLMGDDAASDRYFDRLQEFYPEVPVIKDFLRTFDVSSIINLKNPV